MVSPRHFELHFMMDSIAERVKTRGDRSAINSITNLFTYCPFVMESTKLYLLEQRNKKPYLFVPDFADTFYFVTDLSDLKYKLTIDVAPESVLELGKPLQMKHETKNEFYKLIEKWNPLIK